MSGMIWCVSCASEVAPVATMNGSAQLVQSCPTCESMLGGGALTAPLAATGKLIGEAPERLLPIAQRKQAEVIPMPLARAAPRTPVAHPAETFTLDTAKASLLARLDQLDGERIRIMADGARLAGINAERKGIRKILDNL